MNSTNKGVLQIEQLRVVRGNARLMLRWWYDDIMKKKTSQVQENCYMTRLISLKHRTKDRTFMLKA